MREKGQPGGIQYASPEYFEKSCGKRKFLGNIWGTRWKAYTKIRYRKYLQLTEDMWNNGENRILDTGCSDGDFLYLLWKRNKLNRMYGIDCAKNAVIEAKRRFERFKFKQCALDDIYDSMPAKRFDLIFCTGTLQYVKNYDIIFKGFNKVLKDEGYLLVEYPITFERNRDIVFNIKIFFYIEKTEYEWGGMYMRFFSTMWHEVLQIEHHNFFKWIMALVVLSNYPLAYFFEKIAEKENIGKFGKIYLCKKLETEENSRKKR